MKEGVERAPKVVAGYQRDVRSRLVLALMPGALAWGIGATTLLFGLEPWLAHDPARYVRHRATFHAETAVTRGAAPSALVGIGAVLCLLSPFVFALGLRSSLDNDHYLLFRTDGLAHRVRGTLEIFEWDDIDDASVDGEGHLVIHMQDETFHVIEERFIGASAQDLASKVREIRRKAVWGLLPS
jgi:hypothetical protein